MKASRLLRDHWKSASAAELARALADARDSLAAFAEATATAGSLIQSWVGGAPLLEGEHYPADDVVDSRRGSQFYYHVHRENAVEHGHLHLFWHATSSGRRRYLPRSGARWRRTSPTHLFAISLDARGLPIGLFTVNRWVTDGHWLDASTTMICVERFEIGAVAGHEQSCRWLTGFVRLYQPVVAALLAARDQRLSHHEASAGSALEDRGLETLSAIPIDWAADLDLLEASCAARQRDRSRSGSGGALAPSVPSLKFLPPARAFLF